MQEAQLFNFEIKGNKDIMKVLNRYLERKGIDSENTYYTYLRQITNFFSQTRNKKLEQLNIHDLTFTKQEIEDFQINKVKNDGISPSAINLMLVAVKGFYQKLQDDGFDVDVNWFKVESLKTHTQAYGSLSKEEVSNIVEFVSKQRKGLNKKLLIETAFSTGFRLDSLLTLTINNLVTVDNLKCIEVIGKGNKKDIKQIPEKLFNDLIELSKTHSNNKLFDLSRTTVNNMMATVNANFDFGNRRIVFHSFKKASINEVGILTNFDIKAMQRQGNHSDASTTLNNYVESTNLQDTIAFGLSEEPSLDILDTMSKDEIIALIKSMDRMTINKIHRKAEGLN